MLLFPLSKSCTNCTRGKNDVKSMSADVERLKAPVVDALRVERKKPCNSDFIGYGAKFHKLCSTEEWNNLKS